MTSAWTAAASWIRGSGAGRTAGRILVAPFLRFIVLPIAVLSVPVVLVLSVVVAAVHLLQARRHARLLLPGCRVSGVVPSSESSTGITYEAAALADRPAILAVVSAGPAELGEPWADVRTGRRDAR